MTTTVNAGDLFGMLTDVARTAGKDNTLPVLNGLSLYGDKGVLVAVSTDRFSLSQAHAETEGDTFPEVFLPLSSVKRILWWLKMTPGVKSEQIELAADGKVTFTLGDSTLAESYVDSMVPAVPHLSKIWKSLPVEPLEGHTPGAFGCSPDLFARFAAIAKRRGEYMHVTSWAPQRPIEILIGEQFRGILMPIREYQVNAAPVFVAPHEKAKAAKAA